MNAKVSLLILSLIASPVYPTSNSRYSGRLLSKPTSHHEKRTPPERDCQYNLCENDSGYPATKIEKLVSEHSSFHSFLKGHVIKPIDTGIYIASRMGDEEPMKTFCKTKNVVSRPRLAWDINNIRRHIVNVDNYTQIVKYQTCGLSENKECFEAPLLDIKTKCVQKFSNVKLVTMNKDNALLEYQTFQIPTTCVCTYKRNFE